MKNYQRQMTKNICSKNIMETNVKINVTPAKIRKTTKVKDVTKVAKQLKWNWAGHFSRYEDNRLPKIVEAWSPTDGKRRRGRPSIRWRDDIENFGSCFWRRKTRNKENWKTMGNFFMQLCIVTEI